MLLTTGRVSVLFLLAGGLLPAQTILRVGPTQTFQTIQAAVDAAGAGDRILVDSGTYTESPVIRKGVTVMAAAQPLPLVVGTVTVDGVPAGATATLAGLVSRTWVYGASRTPAFDVRGGSHVVITRCVREVHWEPVSRYGYRVDAAAFLRVTDASVVLSDCAVYSINASGYSSGNDIACAGNPLLELTRARVTVDSLLAVDGFRPVPLCASPSFVSFYSAPSSSPPPVFRALDSVLVVTNTHIGGGLGFQTHAPSESIHATGGMLILAGAAQIIGGSAPSSGAGAAAVHCTGTLVTDRVQLLGGGGNPNGPPVSGTLPRAGRLPDVSGPATFVQPAATATFNARGRSGDPWLWLLDFRLALTAAPGLDGAILHLQPLVVLPAVVPPAEALALAVPIPNQPALLGVSLLVQGVEVSGTSIATSAIATATVR